MSAEEDKLIKRIRDVFDAHTDDSADAGWKELRKKYPEKDRKPLVFWLSSAIAIALLATALWYLTPVGSDVTKTVRKARVDSQSAAKPADQPHGNVRLNTKNIEEAQNRTVDANPASAHLKPTAGKKGDARSSRRRQPAAQPVRRLESTRDQHASSAPQTQAGNNNLKSTVTPNTVPVKNQAAPDTVSRAPYAVQSGSVNSVAAPQKPSSVDTSADKSLKNKRKLPISFYASGYMSYARGSNAHFNAGAGITYAIPLSKSLKFNTGAGLLQTDLLFRNGVLPVTSSGKSYDAFYSLPSAIPGSSASAATSIGVKLVNIDVPVNLLYTFKKSRNGLFIAAGTSSSLFLNETYTYYTLGPGALNNVSLSASAINGRFSEGAGKLNLAHTINLAAGIGYAIGQRERLFFEPFVKLPVAGLGSRHIFYGSAGLNLRLNLSGPGMATTNKR